MPAVFDAITDKFFIAFFESDPEIRRAAIEAWIKDATPVIQSAVENELRSYLDYVLEQTWTPEGWQSRAKKFSGTTQDSSQRRPRTIPFMDGYRLRLDLSITHPWSTRRGEKVQIIDPLSAEAHAETLKIAHRILSQIDNNEAIEKAKQLRNTDETGEHLRQNSSSGNSDDDDDYNDTDEGRSPNDDRSDSMNPNSDAYQASMDNRSDQMNPNNDAYWSSRGR
jgi:hypothetical protein